MLKMPSSSNNDRPAINERDTDSETIDPEPEPLQDLTPPNPAENLNNSQDAGIFGFIKEFIKPKSDPSLRETIEEYIDADNGDELEAADHIAQHEKLLLSNILKLRDETVDHVMVPRADVIAIDVDISKKELLEKLSDRAVSRIPVFKDNLDNVLGTVHIKDILALLANGKRFDLMSIVTQIPFVSPSMPVLDLLLFMRQKRRHMVMVVDEYGGVDGLVTMGDIIEVIVGEIDDEHDVSETPQVVKEKDGSLTADARLDIEEFEVEYGTIFSEEEREESDTLGGLVSTMAGRVPSRGEILKHRTGMVFEVLDADPRRINRLRIKNIPTSLG